MSFPVDLSYEKAREWNWCPSLIISTQTWNYVGRFWQQFDFQTLWIDTSYRLLSETKDVIQYALESMGVLAVFLYMLSYISVCLNFRSKLILTAYISEAKFMFETVVTKFSNHPRYISQHSAVWKGVFCYERHFAGQEAQGCTKGAAFFPMGIIHPLLSTYWATDY